MRSILKAAGTTILVVAVACLTTTVSNTVVFGAVGVDPDVKGYTKVSGVSGNVNSVGSDTLNNLMTFWAMKRRRPTT